jgi:hypothetical protein
MAKKSYKTLLEAYEDISELEMSNPIQISQQNIETKGFDDEAGEVSLEDMEKEKVEMITTRLNSLIAHGHQALEAVKKGSTIEPWMQDLISSSERDIVKTANALVYRHEF